jgi:hypothetical protein
MFEWIMNNKPSLVLIIIYIIIFLGIIGYLRFKNKQNTVIANWNDYRCKPSYLPISGFIKPYSNRGAIMSTVINFNECVWELIKSYFNLSIKPFTFIINIIAKITDTITKIIDVIRNQMKIMRNMLMAIVMKMMKRIENILNTAIFSFSKIHQSMKRQAAIYQNILYLLQTISFTMNGFVKGSLGSMLDMSEWAIWVLPIFTLGPAGALFPMNAFCFGKNTELNLIDNSSIKIKNIKLGMNLKDDGKVISKMKFRINCHTPIFNYCGINVSGSHLVFENNNWLPVSKSLKSKQIEYNDNVLFNINTTENKIHSRGILFKDYNEQTNQKLVRESNNLILKILNNSNEIISPNIKSKNYTIGFSIDTIIDGKNIIDYNLDDKINDTCVIGIIGHLYMGEPMYKIGRIICTELTKIFDQKDKLWKNAKQLGKRINYNHKYLYALITKNHIIESDNYIFRDLFELIDEKDLESVDKL